MIERARDGRDARDITFLGTTLGRLSCKGQSARRIAKTKRDKRRDEVATRERERERERERVVSPM